MLSRKFSILAVLLLVLGTIICEDPQQLQIGEEKTINFKVSGNDATLDEKLAGSFFFKIDKKIPKEDLILLVLGRRDFSHSPSVYFSTVEKIPSYKTYVDGKDTIMCGIMGVDICELPENKIQENIEYYISVYCIKSCKFGIKLKYEEQKQIKLGEHISLLFDETEVKEVRVQTPENIEGEHILFEASLINPGDVSKPFSMLAKQGIETFGQNSADFVAEDLWFNGKGFQINKGDQLWKPNSWYTILIEAQVGSLIVVSSSVYSNHRQLSLEKDIRDIVGLKEIRLFELEIPSYIKFKKSQLSLSFDIEPYMGVVELYVKQKAEGSDDQDIETYKKKGWYQDDVKGQGSLSISHEEIEESENGNTKFVVAIKGATAATFRLLAYTSDITNRALIFDCTETGYADKDEFEYYQLLINDFKQTKVTLTLTQMEGDADLYLKLCKNESNTKNCLVSSEDVKNSESLSKQGNFWLSEKSGGQIDQIKFDFDNVNCNNYQIKDGKNCVYTVAVRGNTTKRSHYKLVARHGNSHIKLIENQPLHEYLLETEIVYFKFQLPDDASVEKIIFHVTAISGEIDVYMNRNDKKPFPDYENSTRTGFSEIESLKFTKSKDGPLKGNYYITVKAWSAAYYNVLVKVYRKKDNGVVKSQKQEVKYGLATNGYLYYKQPETFWFEQNKTDKNKQLTQIFFYYHEYDTKSQNEKQFQLAQPDIECYFYNQATGKRENVNVKKSLKNFQFIYIEIETNQQADGHYEFDLLHNLEQYNNIMYKFSLSVNSQDIWRIIPEYGYVSELNKKQMNQSFEIFLTNPQKVYVELFECIGRVVLKAASTYQKLENNQFDNPLQFVSYKGDHTIAPFKPNHDGEFYFQVQSKQLWGDQDPKAVFMVLPHILPIDAPLPHDVFFIPREGPYTEHETLVNYLDMKSNYAKISFKKLRCADDCIGIDYKVEDFLYILHVTNYKDYLQFFTKCDFEEKDLAYFDIPNTKDLFHRKQTKSYKTDSDNHHDIVEFFLNDLPDEELYYEMMGVVFIKTDPKLPAQPYTFVYEQSTIHFEKAKESISTGKDSGSTNNPKPQDREEEGKPDYGAKSGKQSKKSDVSNVFLYILFMIIGGALVATLLGYYCYKRRGMGLLPQSFVQSDKELAEEEGEA